MIRRHRHGKVALFNDRILLQVQHVLARLDLLLPSHRRTTLPRSAARVSSAVPPLAATGAAAFWRTSRSIWKHAQRREQPPGRRRDALWPQVIVGHQHDIESICNGEPCVCCATGEIEFAWPNERPCSGGRAAPRIDLLLRVLLRGPPR